MLVVATVTKKEFVTLSLKEFQLETNRWVSHQAGLLPRLTPSPPPPSLPLTTVQCGDSLQCSQEALGQE